MMAHKPLRVLLVDDEPAILRMFRTALQGSKFVFSEARDGREALERLDTAEVDVIVTDINMPGHGGLEFLRSVRGRHPDVPVIMMTGKPSLQSSNEASEHGAVQCLVKPVLPATLRDAIERAAQRSATLGDRAEEVALVRCACEACGRTGIAGRLGPDFSRTPAGWFVDATARRFLCSEACVREVGRTQRRTS